jgi:hypothetical protein
MMILRMMMEISLEVNILEAFPYPIGKKQWMKTLNLPVKVRLYSNAD